MKLLVIILNEENYLDDVLSSMVEVGITGATVIDSTRITDVLARDIPIFAGLRQMRESGRTYNKVILGLLEEEGMLKDLIVLLKEQEMDFDQPGVGALFTLPVEDVHGSLEELEF